MECVPLNSLSSYRLGTAYIAFVIQILRRKNFLIYSPLDGVLKTTNDVTDRQSKISLKT